MFDNYNILTLSNRRVGKEGFRNPSRFFVYLVVCLFFRFYLFVFLFVVLFRVSDSVNFIFSYFVFRILVTLSIKKEEEKGKREGP